MRNRGGAPRAKVRPEDVKRAQALGRKVAAARAKADALADEIDATVADLYRGGMPKMRIAQEVGLTRPTVDKCLQRAGITD
jgi:hypothetical protein